LRTRIALNLRGMNVEKDTSRCLAAPSVLGGKLYRVCSGGAPAAVRPADRVRSPCHGGGGESRRLPVSIGAPKEVTGFRANRSPAEHARRTAPRSQPANPRPKHSPASGITSKRSDLPSSRPRTRSSNVGQRWWSPSSGGWYDSEFTGLSSHSGDPYGRWGRFTTPLPNR